MNILSLFFVSYKKYKKGGIFILYGSSKIWLNDLDKAQLQQLQRLALLSRDLYNLSIKTASEHYAETGVVLDFQQVKALIKDKEEYKEITGYYYGVVLSGIADFKKYVNTNSYVKDKSKRTLELKNLSDFRPPMPKTQFYPIMLLKVVVRDGFVILPPTKHTGEIKLKLPENYKDKSISRVTVRPLFQFKSWQMIIEYPVEAVKHNNIEKNKSMGIDLGINNFATVALSDGSCFIIDGKPLKNILQGYCKFRAKMTSESGGQHNTKRLISLHRKTQCKIDDYVRKSVNYIIKYCLDNHIGKVVLGWGIHFMTFDLGINNQMYSLFPFARFKDLLCFKCKQYSIDFETVDESFTSVASFLDGDQMPEHVVREKQNFSGKRRYRGLYVSKNGTKINADVNGALNILRKGNAVINIDLSGRGIATPKRVNPLKV